MGNDSRPRPAERIISCAGTLTIDLSPVLSVAKVGLTITNESSVGPRTLIFALLPVSILHSVKEWGDDKKRRPHTVAKLGMIFFLSGGKLQFFADVPKILYYVVICQKVIAISTVFTSILTCLCPKDSFLCGDLPESYRYDISTAFALINFCRQGSRARHTWSRTRACTAPRACVRHVGNASCLPATWRSIV